MFKLSETARPGTELLPAAPSASGFAAKPLSFEAWNGQTVYNHTLYKKQENKKAMPKHCNGVEPAMREKARAPIRTGANSNGARRWNRYTTSELSTSPIHDIYNLVFLK